MKRTLTFLLCLCLLGMGTVSAQGTFLLRGKAMNLPADKQQFELVVTHPYKGVTYIVPVRSDGMFEQSFPIAGEFQEVCFMLGNGLTVFATPGDTLNLEFDAGKLSETLNIWGQTPAYSRELKLCMEIDKHFRERALKLNLEAYAFWDGKLDADTIVRHVVSSVKDMQQLIGDFKQAHEALPHEDYFYQKAYFEPMLWLVRDDISLEKARREVRLYPDRPKLKLPYRDSDFDFLAYPPAREFIEYYIKKGVEKVCNLFDKHQTDMEEIKYQIADLVIPNKRLRDWYQVISQYAWIEFDSMDKGKKWGDRLMATLDDPEAKSFLRHQMDSFIEPFISGAPARDMTLVDLDGREVSLSSLRGKYVYMDIWGLGCGVCNMEFEKAQAFHDKYAAYGDKLVCVFVCEHGDKESCRKYIEKYNLGDKGIHLYVDAVHQEEVKKYSQGMFPTYVLISPDGKIVEYNTARPSELLGDRENILDRCLKK